MFKIILIVYLSITKLTSGNINISGKDKINIFLLDFQIRNSMHKSTLSAKIPFRTILIRIHSWLWNVTSLSELVMVKIGKCKLICLHIVSRLCFIQVTYYWKHIIQVILQNKHIVSINISITFSVVGFVSCMRHLAKYLNKIWYILQEYTHTLF